MTLANIEEEFLLASEIFTNVPVKKKVNEQSFHFLLAVM